MSNETPIINPPPVPPALPKFEAPLRGGSIPKKDAPAKAKPTQQDPTGDPPRESEWKPGADVETAEDTPLR